MRKILSFAVIALVAITLQNCKKEAQDNGLSIYSIIGDVKLISNSIEKTPAIGDVLNEGDILKTGDMSVADILMGNEGIIRVQQNSHVRMASLMTKTSNDTQLDMENGKIHVTLSKMRKGTFSVKTPTAVASVRGTSFRITAGKTISRLDVIKGKVKINPVKNDKIITDVESILEESQTTQVDEVAVEKAIKEKKEIKVDTLKEDEIKKIKAEVKDIKHEVIEKLDKEAKKELKEDILDLKANAKDEKEEELKREEEKALALKKQREETARKKKLDEQARLEKDRKEKERLEKERLEKERKEKERRDRASNIPTL